MISKADILNITHNLFSLLSFTDSDVRRDVCNAVDTPKQEETNENDSEFSSQEEKVLESARQSKSNVTINYAVELTKATLDMHLFGPFMGFLYECTYMYVIFDYIE